MPFMVVYEYLYVSYMLWALQIYNMNNAGNFEEFGWNYFRENLDLAIFSNFRRTS